jgi:hypothetical protein
MRCDDEGCWGRKDDHQGSIGGRRQDGSGAEVWLTVDWAEGRVVRQHWRIGNVVC